jgi:methionyl-tRNA formyltransferase
MDKGLDTGNIIEQFSVDISPNDTYRTVYDKLAKLAYEKIKDKVNDFFRSNVKVAKQDDKNATYANNITPEIEKIN